MSSLMAFFKRYLKTILLVIAGFVLIILALEVLTGTPGFVFFFTGAVLIIVGILVVIY